MGYKFKRCLGHLCEELAVGSSRRSRLVRPRDVAKHGATQKAVEATFAAIRKVRTAAITYIANKSTNRCWRDRCWRDRWT